MPGKGKKQVTPPTNDYVYDEEVEELRTLDESLSDDDNENQGECSLSVYQEESSEEDAVEQQAEATTKPSTPKPKRSQDKTSISDRKAIYSAVSSVLKSYAVTQQKAFDELVSTVNDLVMTTNRTVSVAKTVKKVPQEAFLIDDIAPCFTNAYLESYTKKTITSRDLINLMVTHTYDGDLFRKTPDVYSSLAFSPTEINILTSIKDDASPLNINKADNKIILAKLTKPISSFTHQDVVYSIDDGLWDKLLENKHISEVVSDKNTSMTLCPVALGDSMKAAFKRTPSFSGKFMTKETFNSYIASVTRKVTNIYTAVPVANKQILKYLSVPYVHLDRQQPFMYTKMSLLKAAFLDKVDPQTKKFDVESISAFASVFPGLDMNKVKVDELVNRCLYSVSN